MMSRYDMMEALGVTNFRDFKTEDGKLLSAMMLLVEEAYPLFVVEGQKTDEGKQRDQWHGEALQIVTAVSRLGRAAGIHMVVATQWPDGKVVSGALRNNLQMRVAAGRLNTLAASVMFAGVMMVTNLPHIRGRGLVFSDGEVRETQFYHASSDATGVPPGEPGNT